MARPDLAHALANAFLAGDWTRGSMLQRAKVAIGDDVAWLPQLVRATLASFPSAPHDERDVLARWILRSHALSSLIPGQFPPIRRFFVDRPRMGRGPWPVPDIATSADLARFLGLELGEL